MNKKIVSVGLGAGLIAGTFAGLVAVPALSGAQTSGPSTTAAPADQGRPDPAGHIAVALKPLVDGGTINQSQADAVIAALKAEHEANPRRGGKGGPGPAIEAVAQAIGVSAADLRTALQTGQTFAQVAESNGVDPQVVIDAVAAAMRTHIAQEVTNGELTQAEADQKLANVDQRAADIVNNPRPTGGPEGRGGPRGPGGPRGHGGHGGAPSTTN